MDFLSDFAANVLAESACRMLRSILPNSDKTVQYRQRLANKVRLARAIMHQVCKPRRIKNKHLRAWRSALIAAADEGDLALQSSTAKTGALKNTLMKLQSLTTEANIYLILLNSERKGTLRSAEVDTVAARLAAAAGFPYMIPFIAPRYTSDNRNLNYLFDLSESAMKEALNSTVAAAAGNPDTPIYVAPTPTIDYSALHNILTVLSGSLKSSYPGGETFFPVQKSRDMMYPAHNYCCEKKLATQHCMSLARTHSQSKQLCPDCEISKMISGRISKKHRRRLVIDMKAITCMGLFPEGTEFLSNPIGYGFCKELQKNSFWPYDSTNRGLISNSIYSINDCMKMKGKCPEAHEFDEQIGYGEASMPALSCFPPGPCGPAGDHDCPSFDSTPEENDG